MIRRTFVLAWLSLVVLAGCNGGGGHKGGGGALASLTSQCFVERQPVSCTNPGSQTVGTITPEVEVAFKEPMNRTSVERNVEVTIENLTDSVSIRNTVEGHVSAKLVEIAWNSASTELTARVLQVVRQLEDGKSYRVTANPVPGQCVETATGTRACEGTLGPFLFKVDVP